MKNTVLAALLAALFAPAAAAQSFEAMTAKGEKAAKRGESDAAVEYYTSALRVWDARDGKKAKSKVLKARGDLHERAGDIDEALADFTSALKLEPKNGPLLRRRGELYLRLSKPAQAITDFYQATSLNLGDREAYFGRGVAYELQGDLKFAEEDYRTACRLGLKKACGNASAAKKRLLQPLSEAAEFEEASERKKGPVEIKKPKKKRRYALDFESCLATLEACLEEGEAFGVCVRRNPVCEKSSAAGCCPESCVRDYERLAAGQLSEASAFREVFKVGAKCANP